jgi:hypothetical protein
VLVSSTAWRSPHVLQIIMFKIDEYHMKPCQMCVKCIVLAYWQSNIAITMNRESFAFIWNPNLSASDLTLF